MRNQQGELIEQFDATRRQWFTEPTPGTRNYQGVPEGHAYDAAGKLVALPAEAPAPEQAEEAPSAAPDEAPAATEAPPARRRPRAARDAEETP